MDSNSFLLYGANGYTGELITRYAEQYHLKPVLAGRSKDAIEAMAKKFNLPYLIFDLDDKEALLEALRTVKLVIHAAGPFEFTAKQMIEACLQTGTHYLDINGDIAVFEMIKQYDDAAKKAGIMLLPGAGFDVVPTDCLALALKKLIPDAVTLKLAFFNEGGGLSHGTATTIANKIGEGGAVRKAGRIIAQPLGKSGIWVKFGPGKLFAMSIPWGDISTAYFTTGIPNIETYTGISPKTYRLLKMQFLVNWLLRTKLARKYIKKKINERPAGPSDEQRSRSTALIWGQATNAMGKTDILRLIGPDGYTLTAYSTLIMAEKVLKGDFIPGYQTPASAYGVELVLEIPGVKWA